MQRTPLLVDRRYLPSRPVEFLWCIHIDHDGLYRLIKMVNPAFIRGKILWFLKIW